MNSVVLIIEEFLTEVHSVPLHADHSVDDKSKARRMIDDRMRHAYGYGSTDAARREGERQA